jgi:hypothetical protein
MPRPVLLLLGLVFGTALAVHDSVLDVASFTGFRVYRVLPASEEDLQLLDSLQASPYYDFWTEVKNFLIIIIKFHCEHQASRQTYKISKEFVSKVRQRFFVKKLAKICRLYYLHSSFTVGVEWIFFKLSNIH